MSPARGRFLQSKFATCREHYFRLHPIGQNASHDEASPQGRLGNVLACAGQEEGRWVLVFVSSLCLNHAEGDPRRGAYAVCWPRLAPRSRRGARVLPFVARSGPIAEAFWWTTQRILAGPSNAEWSTWSDLRPSSERNSSGD